MKKLVLILLVVFPATGIAGGDHFRIEVLEFVGKGNNEYKMHFIQLSQPYGKKHEKDRELIVHFQFKSKRKDLNIELYNKSIEYLKEQIEKSKLIDFGIMAGGYKKIPGTNNEYQSKGLEIYKGVVYSYHE